MTSLLLALALGAGALSNFPREAGGKVSQAAIGTVAGGGPAVIVAAGDLLTGFRPDGETPSGLPLQLGEEGAVGSPAAADMDGDGRPEIAVATPGGKVYLWSGGPVAGWPVSLGARARAGVSFADVDGDGKPEVVIGDERGRIFAFKKNGAAAKGFPLNVGRPVTSTVSASIFAGGRSLAVGCEDGKVHVLDLGGRERAGFPLVTHFAVSGPPVFADVDDDGSMDLVVASQDFSVYAVNGKGEALPGFPVAAQYRVYDGPALADVDGDGKLEIFFASADGFLHAVDSRGRKLPGFPVKAGARIFGGPAIGDLDRDGSLDVVVASADGQVHAFTKAGKPLPGFPASTGVIGEVTAAPLLFDLAGDGMLSAFVGLPSGDVQALRATRAGNAPAVAPWAGPGGDAQRGGRFGPNPPTYKDLALAPGQARVTDRLTAGWRGVWLDAAPGEPAPTPKITWLKNGTVQPSLQGKKELPAGTARKGERWRFVLQAPAGGATFESAEVAILDTPPGAPGVSIDPAEPTRGGPVRAVVSRAAPDADDDPLTYDIDWLQDGLETGVTGDTFPGDRLRKGSLLTARITASDGEARGAAGHAQARVGDTAPGPLAALLEPPLPSRTDALRAQVAQPSIDVDGDPLTYRFRWTVAGQPLNVPFTTAELPAGTARKHQLVMVDIRAWDGAREGPPATVQAEVKNTPPGPPRVTILPARPRKGDALRAVLTGPSSDPDQDPIAYRFSWKKNGGPIAAAGDGREIPGASVERGDRFEVSVVPNDGESDGLPAQAAVSVVNTPPVPPRIVLEPRHPRGGEPIKLVVLEPARDADGDPVTLGIAWTREGRPTGQGGETLLPADFRKHERVRVVMTPRDAEEAGPSVADEVLVEDAPPTAPVVAFSSARPVVTAPLGAVLQAAAKDPDGDALHYRYRWFRDGVPVPLVDGTEAARGAPWWTGASEVPAAELKKGQRWVVEVQAGDGELWSPTARAEVVIANSPPPPPRLAFTPARPRRVDGLAVVLEQPADADADVVTWRYAWTRNGAPFPTPPDQAQIPRDVPRKGERWGVEVVAGDGEAESPPTRLEVVIADTAPGPTAIALCDGPVPVNTAFQARVVTPATDADGDAVTYRHEWAVNGKVVPGAAAQPKLAGASPRKHDVVRVTVTPFDGELAGPAASAECEVVNTAPTAPAVALEPAEPIARSGLVASVRKGAVDRDGDPVSYRYAWTRNGVPASYDGPTVPPAVLRHGETWRVEVTPFDGEEPGERVVLTAVVKNTPPSTPSVLIRPESAVVGESLLCDVQAPAVDADQEPLTTTWRWYRNDKLDPLAEGQQTLPASVVRRGERWKCEAWVSDGTADSPHASAEVIVKNSPPASPVVSIEPEKPRKADDLLCRISAAAADPDGDAVTYTYAWWRNERPMPNGADPARVEASRISRGEKWRCAATPSDGAQAGVPGGAERIVSNTPPGPARVRLEPAAPRSGQAIRCEVTGKSEDVDGDAVRYRYAWQRNGVAQPFAESSQEVPSRLVKSGDRWRCVVIPNDGTDDGVTAGSEEVLVTSGIDG